MEAKKQWQIDISHASDSHFKKFNEKYPREYESLFANLQRVIGVLNSGHKINTFQVGHFRSESDGLYRVGQNGFPGAKESRLYLYPDSETMTMYVISIGTKDGQSGEINEAKQTVSRIRGK